MTTPIVPATTSNTLPTVTESSKFRSVSRWDVIKAYALTTIALISVAITAVSVFVSCLLGSMNLVCGILVCVLSALMFCIILSFCQQIRMLAVTKQLSNEVSRLEQENKVLHKETRALAESNLELEQLVQDFKGLHTLFQQYGDQLLKSGTSLATTAEQFKQRLSSFESRLQGTLSPLESFLNNIRMLTSESTLETLSSRVQDLLAHTQALEASITSLQSTSHSLEGNIKLQEEQIKELEKQKESLQKVVAELQGTAKLVDEKIKVFASKVLSEDGSH